METRKKVSSLDGVKYSSKRRDGNTTRIIDNAIQIIFNGDICVCEDNADYKGANRNLFKRILKRIYNEVLVEDEDLEIDKVKLEISIKPWQ